MKRKRLFFKKGNMAKRFYKDMVSSCKEYKRNVCNDKGCYECPFRLAPYCLMNILIAEFGAKKDKEVENG